MLYAKVLCTEENIVRFVQFATIIGLKCPEKGSKNEERETNKQKDKKKDKGQRENTF